MSNENDLSGGIRNALDRGEDIEKIKQSFINAGYKPEDVENATQLAFQSPMPIGPTAPIGPLESQETQELPQRKSNKTLWTVFIILSILILISAGLAGLYWNKTAHYMGKIISTIKSWF